jgi:tetratricopeptide (TPR) repeat protein
MQLGNTITQRDDRLSFISPDELFRRIKTPTEADRILVGRLRLVRSIDPKQYAVLKKQLPYIVCGVFNPPFRRTENFGLCEYFMVDIDHISEKSLVLDVVKERVTKDPRTLLCFVSPSEDGLKILFRLSEKCYDAGKYSLFYKCFVNAFSQQYGLEQALDARTSDVSRACFLSYDPEAYYNPDAEAVSIADYVDFDNPFETREREVASETAGAISTAGETASDGTPVASAEPPPPRQKEPDDEALAFIKQKLNQKRTAPRQKPQVYVPEQLDEILERLLAYIAEAGVVVEEVCNISYGKKFRMKAGMSQAEVNLFFGKKGFSVVKSPRQGTSESLNELMTAYIQGFIGDYVMYRENAALAAEATLSAEAAGAVGADGAAGVAATKDAPDSLSVIRQQAQLLFTEKNFREALPLYETLWETFPAACNEWDGWRYAFSARKTGDAARALNVCRKVYSRFRDFPNIRNVYAWSIYDSEFRKDKITDEARFLRAGEGIMKLSSQNDEYSPYTLAIFKILDYLGDKANYPTDKILEWTEKLNPGLLDEQPFVFTDKTGKVREIASKREQYYMVRTRALLEKGEYDECIKLCEEALQAFDELHYDNRTWFRWRVALCHEAMGRLEQAMLLMRELLNTKREWFIQKEIAAIYFKQGKNEEALRYCLDSALSRGEARKKVNLLRLLSEILFRMGWNEEAKLHLDLLQAFKTPDLSDDVFYERKLVDLWKSRRELLQVKLTGVIHTILPTGNGGFVSDNETRRNYFFRMREFRSKPELAVVGTPVTFILQDGFDTKKGRPVQNAAKVKAIK